MMVSGGSKGEDGPGSTMKPVPFEDVWKVTDVPGFTQKRELPLALGNPGVAVAPFIPSRLMSTVQEAPEQVLSAVQRLCGLGSAQTYLPFACALAMLASRTIEAELVSRTTRVRWIFISSSFTEVSKGFGPRLSAEGRGKRSPARARRYDGGRCQASSFRPAFRPSR